MTQTYKKKLIEVAIPLEAINIASQHEKAIRQGHPSSLHQWWARRPLAACRAVIFAQLVDDPSSHPDRFPTEAEQTLERARLFRIIEDLVRWENTNDKTVLENAHREIKISCGETLPAIYDPFSGAASIPLEAQKLGLPSFGSDLNPVAVSIGKALVEFPQIFNAMPPINPDIRQGGLQTSSWSGTGAQGMAADIRHYGERVRDNAHRILGALYPEIELPKESGGKNAKVIAWIWARTVASPNPAFAGAETPLVKSFQISSKKGDERWIEVEVDKERRTLDFRVTRQKPKLLETVGRTAAVCLFSGDPIPLDYIQREGRSGRLGVRLMAVVVEGHKGRHYLSPGANDEVLSASAPDSDFSGAKIDHWRSCTNCVVYGMTDFAQLFTRRQIYALSKFSDCIRNIRQDVIRDAVTSGLPRRIQSSPSDVLGRDADSYADAITLYLAFALDKMADLNNSLCRWEPKAQCPRNMFGKQAIPMVWDFAEANPFSRSSGSWSTVVRGIAYALESSLSYVNNRSVSSIIQADAREFPPPAGDVVITTDPPYYDNIPYSNLSDFFYIWLRRTIGDNFPELYSTLVVPRASELVANQFRQGSKENAEDFFLRGMKSAIARMSDVSSSDYPTIIFYAFKQSEVGAEGVSSKGWATFLEAVISSGYSVIGTWPIRTENTTRMMGQGTNALASSVALVCRKADSHQETTTRAEFIRALKRELPAAIADLQAANIAPADMPQSAIGPGMGVFSRYKAVLESDDTAMGVATALELINRELDEYLGGIQGEFDADTRFAITWFEQHGLAKGDYGAADNLARARGISVESVKHAGIIESIAGKVRILARDELDDDWDPIGESHQTVWECLQHLVRQYENDGISHDTAVLLQKIESKSEAVKDLAYCLYDICANKRKDAKEATAYNALIADWTELTRQAAAIHETSGSRQSRLSI